MRYLEQLADNERIGGVVFVAGFTDDLGYRELKNFFETPLDFEKIKSRAGYFTAIHSDDDPYVPFKHGDILKEKLGAKLIVMHAMKHFSGAKVYNESCTSLPEVSRSIFDMV